MTAEAPARPLDEGDPSLDSRAFRRCLGQFATGLTVVTAQSGDDRVGVTVNSFSSLSLDPPLILWCINRNSGSLPTFLAASHFAVNILASGQIELSRRFANSRAPKFEGLGYTQGKCGAPILDGVVAHLECRRVAAHDGGDHVIIVGHVEHFARYEGDSLLFVQGGYGVIEHYPENGPKALFKDDRPAVQENSLLTLLFRAYHSISASFQKDRDEEGISLSQSRVLAQLYETPGISMETLVRTVYAARRDVEDAVAELAEGSCIERDQAGGLALSARGRARREALLARAQRFESERVAKIPAAEVATGRRFLQDLIRTGPPPE